MGDTALVKLQSNRLTILEKMLVNFKKDSASRKTKPYFQQRLKRIDELKEEFSATHKTIVCSDIPDDDEYLTTDVASQFEELHLELYCSLTMLQMEMFPPAEEKEPPVTQKANETQVRVVAPAQFPRLPVPSFSGKFIDWPSFHDSFNRLIHNNLELNSIQKFHYLKQALVVDRDRDIQQMLLTEANYSTAWELLIKRYDNPRIIFAHHMNTLYNLPVLLKEKSDDIKTLLNVANVCVNEFKRLKLPIGECDHWIAHYLTTKLPVETHSAWERHLGNKIGIPTFSDLQDYLTNRLFTIDAIENRTVTFHTASSRSASTENRNSQLQKSKPAARATHNVKAQHATTKGNMSSSESCTLCGQGHILRRCPTFLSKDCFERKNIVDKTKLCLNCLSKSHAFSQCTSSKNCLQCGQRHHTLLHFPRTFQTNTPTTAAPHATPSFTPASGSTSFGAAANLQAKAIPGLDTKRVTNAHATLLSNTAKLDTRSAGSHSPKQILLATALVLLRNEATNQSSQFYALIDHGSEETLISENAVQRLGLRRHPTSADICGVGPGSQSQSKFVVGCMLHSCHDDHFAARIDSAYVLNQLTTELPSRPGVPQQLDHVQGLTLADPLYYQPKKIDIIIGADMIAQILLPEMRIGASNQPVAQKTSLGWILLGRINSSPPTPVTVRCHHTNIELENLVQRFYESEQVSTESPMSEQDQWCEEWFRQTCVRQANGKYMVRLPLKSIYDPNQTLGKSRQIALSRFLHLERKLQRDETFKAQYTDGIEDYFRCHQIVPAASTEEQHYFLTSSNKPSYSSCILPHHAVITTANFTTKIRIVYDASSKTSNGRSLNDLLVTGPPLQNDLPAVILNWRLHQFVFIADIQKMYRCIDIHPDDAHYQRILWRDQEGRVREYCLTTVTFGTASAPYTAIRVIHQLAADEKERFPLAEDILLNEVYVDDVLSGSDSVSTAIQMRNQLMAALQSAGMELRKWSSNTPRLLQDIPAEHQSLSSSWQLNEDHTIKTLGLQWQPNNDFLTFSLNFSVSNVATKRSALGTIARIFDPLGLLSPITIAAKIILKEIWTIKVKRQDDKLTGLEWDEELPPSMAATWSKFVGELPNVETITIPRWLNYTRDVHSMELHAFCDGSSVAYAAAVYLRIQYLPGEVYTHLITSKSKVTPKNPITIPRVELCGAVLATTLAKWAQQHLHQRCGEVPIYYWTDATIVLYWIAGEINRWKLYVANRVSKIAAVSSPSQWRHIATQDNPADCATRGLTATQLQRLDLWWKGPVWLRQDKSTWPLSLINHDDIDSSTTEEKPAQVLAHTTTTQTPFLLRYSSYTHLLRVTAWLLRFLQNLRKPQWEDRQHGPLTKYELQRSLFRIVSLVQGEVFAADIRCIKANTNVPNNSPLVSLTPFIDEHEVIRIRGRLKHSNLPYDQKHPMILPKNHHFTKLLINFAHQITLHGGTQLSLTYIRRQFWIIQGQKTVRNQLRHCITCFRHQPQSLTQLMGDLPAKRVNPPQRAFLATGVDYTGAIELKSSKYRGHTTYKGYIAIFICLATKAVHLEAVTSMSTEHFLWALQRFIGRRGLCHDIYSDCGTNFIGADTILKANHKKFRTDVERDILPKLTEQHIQWHFNPSHSPNFGGLWEANVKSVKYHLKRAVGGTRLTYEQLSTVLIRIEACLNSRPLCPLTADPDDLLVLTPGHFLIGDALLAAPEAPAETKSLSTQHFELQRLVNQFWTRWSSDWLSHLQARPKWRTQERNLSVGELVLIKDDRMPPNEWLLGRVTELHPGSDTLVRVVTVRTQHGLYKRSVSKICRLPITPVEEPEDIN